MSTPSEIYIKAIETDYRNALEAFMSEIDQAIPGWPIE